MTFVCSVTNSSVAPIIEFDAFVAGSWDTKTNHQANLYGSPLNAHDAVQYYHSHGVARSKLVLGIPLYGRSFSNTQGPGHPFSGVGQGTWEAGIYDYRVLPLPGYHVSKDYKLGASWMYDTQRKEMVSFDDEVVGEWKGEYIKKEGLGGSMFWELSGDKGPQRDGMEGGFGKDLQYGKSLINIVKNAMGPLHKGENWLKYEKSKFDNMRQGMP